MIRPPEEEAISAATHFLSSVAALFLTFLLILLKDLTPQQSLPLFLMGTTAGWTFFSSYLYHSSLKQPRRERNRIVDKSAIYLMIAGNGSALCLVGPANVLSLICCLSLILIAGILTANICIRKEVTETFAVTSYVLMGWLAVLPCTGLLGPGPSEGGYVFLFLLLGGVAYSMGVIFYVQDSKRWYHTIWHLFATTGFAFHFLTILSAIQLI